MAPTDLIDAALPQTFNMLKNATSAKLSKVKHNKTRCTCMCFPTNQRVKPHPVPPFLPSGLHSARTTAFWEHVSGGHRFLELKGNLAIDGLLPRLFLSSLSRFQCAQVAAAHPDTSYSTPAASRVQNQDYGSFSLPPSESKGKTHHFGRAGAAPWL